MAKCGDMRMLWQDDDDSHEDDIKGVKNGAPRGDGCTDQSVFDCGFDKGLAGRNHHERRGTGESRVPGAARTQIGSGHQDAIIHFRVPANNKQGQDIGDHGEDKYDYKRVRNPFFCSIRQTSAQIPEEALPSCFIALGHDFLHKIKSIAGLKTVLFGSQMEKKSSSPPLFYCCCNPALIDGSRSTCPPTKKPLPRICRNRGFLSSSSQSTLLTHEMFVKSIA